MTPHLLERRLDPPAPDEAAEDRFGLVVEVSAEEGLRLTPAGRIAHQHPADGRRRQAGVVPDRSAGDDLQDTTLVAIPLADPHPGPARGRVGQHVGEFGQTLAFAGLRATLAGPAGR